MRGAFFTLGQLILQVALTFCISMYVALRAEHEWAKRTSLIGMLTIQGAMAAWALIADPADRLEGVITCLVSLIEASATSILLAAACLRDTALSQQTSTLKTMGLVSAGLLMGAVFAPIGLSVYDNVLLPTANAYQMRKDGGQSTCRAVLGIVVQNVTLPVVIIANIFGWSFKVVDVLEAAAGEANTTASDGSVARRSVTAGNTGRELGATEFAAVLKLQNAWRQQQGRRQLQQRRFELAKASAMASAATRVQAVLRKWHTSNVTQLKAARKMQESCRAHIRNRQLDAAVVKIQAGWRGYAVRRSTKSPNGKTFVEFFDVIPAWD